MSYWIWYPGDMELYYGMKQNFGRVERGYSWPAFWKSEGFRNRIILSKEYNLSKPETFTFYAVKGTSGHCVVRTREEERKYPIGATIPVPAGKVKIILHLACIEHFPAAFADGDVISSDGSWLAGDYASEEKPAGCSSYFQDPAHEPTSWIYQEKEYLPIREECKTNSIGEKGVLFSFETELTAQMEVTGNGAVRQVRDQRLLLYEGESKAEVLDAKWCYYSFVPDPETGRTPRAAVRYVFVPGVNTGDLKVRAIHQYIDIPVRASFDCSDPLVNQIWKTAEHTFRLCSGIFFIDGIKRDTWIWGGDAYQSSVVNRYLLGDMDIDRRTFTALRGNDPVTTHINTIVDYSLLWLIGIREHYDTYGDIDYLRFIWPKMESLMQLFETQRDENGFLVGRKNDWIYVDWADFDKEGPLCAEQMLLIEALRCMYYLAEIMVENDSDGAGTQDEPLPGAEKSGQYRQEAEELQKQVDRFFWDPEKNAYIDSFASGKKHVTKHANILAILYDIADDARKKILCECVLLNPDVPAITTPYFRFFELDALCRMGYLETVWNQIHSYWGGMLNIGAVTFWEQYDPEKPLKEQYEMYGDPFGKSLCHAWAASPIYLLGRYFVGLEVKNGGKDYELHPHMEFFNHLDCTLPAGKINLRITWDGREVHTEEL